MRWRRKGAVVYSRATVASGVVAAVSFTVAAIVPSKEVLFGMAFVLTVSLFIGLLITDCVLWAEHGRNFEGVEKDDEDDMRGEL